MTENDRLKARLRSVQFTMGNVVSMAHVDLCEKAADRIDALEAALKLIRDARHREYLEVADV